MLTGSHLMCRLLPYCESQCTMRHCPCQFIFFRSGVCLGRKGGERAGSEEREEKIKKVLTHGVSCGIINPALRTVRYARVVELVDSLASGASARKGVRVRLPPRAPKRKTSAYSRCLSFWVPPPVRRLHPSVIEMLGRNEFALRQGFGLKAKTLVRAKRAPSEMGPHMSRADHSDIILSSVVIRHKFVSFLSPERGKTQNNFRILSRFFSADKSRNAQGRGVLFHLCLCTKIWYNK